MTIEDTTNERIKCDREQGVYLTNPIKEGLHVGGFVKFADAETWLAMEEPAHGMQANREIAGHVAVREKCTDSRMCEACFSGQGDCKTQTLVEAKSYVAVSEHGETADAPPVTYPEFVVSRFKPADATATDLAKCSGHEAQMVHVALGLAGEWFEYKTSTSRANMLEELGDFWFFYNAGRQVMNLLPASDAMRDAFAGVYGHVEATGLIDAMLVHLLDYAKKPAIYRKPVGLSDELISYYNSTHAAFVAIIEHHGFTLQEVEAANVAKLSKRYVKGYSNEAAQARADKVE